jgi:hypothetical protein
VPHGPQTCLEHVSGVLTSAGIAFPKIDADVMSNDSARASV